MHPIFVDLMETFAWKNNPLMIKETGDENKCEVYQTRTAMPEGYEDEGETYEEPELLGVLTVEGNKIVYTVVPESSDGWGLRLECSTTTQAWYMILTIHRLEEIRLP